MNDDDALPEYIVDTRGEGDDLEFLVYKLSKDAWGKPYYAPSSIAPLSRTAAFNLALALGRRVANV